MINILFIELILIFNFFPDNQQIEKVCSTAFMRFRRAAKKFVVPPLGGPACCKKVCSSAFRRSGVLQKSL